MAQTAKATAAKKADEKKAPTMAPVKKEQTPTAAPVQPLNERIKQARQQADLVHQWESLQEYRKDLDSFKFGGDGVRQGITITDGEREFRSTRTEHLEKIVASLLDMIDSKIEEVESLIK